MKQRFLFALLIVFVAFSCSGPAKISKSDNQVVDQLKAHIGFLADDKLEGRRTGMPGEKLAMDYISDQFKQIGLAPAGTDGYIQPFEVYDGKQIDKESYLILDGDTLQAPAQYFPFAFSPVLKLDATPSVSVQEAGMPWFIDLKETMEENKTNPHFDLVDYIRKNTVKANERGATAVFLFNSSTIADNLEFDKKDRAEKTSIPVIYLSKETSAKHLADQTATVRVVMNINVSEKKRTGHNVVGFLDNHAATTVILGAHFDHLGYGEDGNSMIRHFDSPQIHNGADDNASGTAALIEISKKLKDSKLTANNYLFVAFSGEELGLFGSKYFADHSPVDLKNASYMINMDMVGRLNDSTHVITVGGYGTSPAWGKIYENAALDIKEFAPLRFKYDSAGSGPSDHTSFYKKDIPVLFFFTGLHTDYHKPSDDADKINYTGEQVIINHIYKIIDWMNSQPRPAFTKTREVQSSTNARFSVSMGIMPDYTFAGTGVKADGVTDGKPAQKAGLQAGDIILQLGDYPTNSLEGYMQALGKMKKGDRVKVVYMRGKDKKEAVVEF